MQANCSWFDVDCIKEKRKLNQLAIDYGLNENIRLKYTDTQEY